MKNSLKIIYALTSMLCLVAIFRALNRNTENYAALVLNNQAVENNYNSIIQGSKSENGDSVNEDGTFSVANNGINNQSLGSNLKRINAYQGKMYGNDTLGYIHLEGDWYEENWLDEEANSDGASISENSEEPENIDIESIGGNPEESDGNTEEVIDSTDELTVDGEISEEDETLAIEDSTNQNRIYLINRGNRSLSISFRKQYNPYDFINTSDDETIERSETEAPDGTETNETESTEIDENGTEETNDTETGESTEDSDEGNTVNFDINSINLEEYSGFTNYGEKCRNDLIKEFNIDLNDLEQTLVYEVTDYNKDLSLPENGLITLKTLGNEENVQKAKETIKNYGLEIKDSKDINQKCKFTKLGYKNRLMYIYEFYDGYVYIIELKSSSDSIALETLEQCLNEPNSYNKLIGFIDYDDYCDKFKDALYDIIKINPKGFGLINENPSHEEIITLINTLL